MPLLKLYHLYLIEAILSITGGGGGGGRGGGGGGEYAGLRLFSSLKRREEGGGRGEGRHEKLEEGVCVERGNDLGCQVSFL